MLTVKEDGNKFRILFDGKEFGHVPKESLQNPQMLQNVLVKVVVGYTEYCNNNISRRSAGVSVDISPAETVFDMFTFGLF